ncbi:DUF2304 domain-containing protein [Propionimicrobium sp. PCR01-08-3]|uniref:DUF2304 domain-containing protein n=1 Tax=Propionimicrobium sp. PCR01-08-3 TaxID=3052086 RepID=UPI00255CD460|nr:DUF2304 domain-containing protein [Propionimicrobium sp. PCR01-08-3]WIY82625.1 DUF2304 domain-containing protein [Propionimicrobium sp. PCR01-08-3]
MRGTIFFLITAVLTLILLFNLVRSRRLREKYVALWMLVGLVIIVLALFPGLLSSLAHLVGVQVPSNLLFALAILLLLAVCLQLSLEVSKTEAKSRTLAEHVAILDLQMRRLDDRVKTHKPEDDQPGQSPSDTDHGSADRT